MGVLSRRTHKCLRVRHLRLTVLPQLLVMVLIWPASAAIVEDPDPASCVTNDPDLVCDWVIDTPRVGVFHLVHPDPVDVSESHTPGSTDPLFGSGSFVSPSGFWRVRISLIEDSESALNNLGFDLVTIRGEMQHIDKTDFDDNSFEGDTFFFDITDNTFYITPTVREGLQTGAEDHTPHADIYPYVYVDLTGGIVGSSFEASDYLFQAGGYHDGDGESDFEILQHDPDLPAGGDFGNPSISFSGTDTTTLSFSDINLDTILLNGGVPSAGDPLLGAQVIIDNARLIRSAPAQSVFGPVGIRVTANIRS